MTQRHYYFDAYTTKFSAQVVSQLRVEGRYAVILDESYFYPMSGGQPHDVGRLNGVEVVEVVVREEDGAVLHFVDGEVSVGEASAEIDFKRRFDHMQQHTGQHILSRAFIQTVDADTIGFHLGEETCTIDLNTATLSERDLATAEKLANEIIWQNRAVTARFVAKEALGTLALRKIPDVAGDSLRIVEIADFDTNACGGTHVAHCGEVGMIKILRSERQKRNTRITFVCGSRALADYRAKNRIVSEVSAELTCGADDLLPNIRAIRQDFKTARKQLKNAQSALLDVELIALQDEMVKIGDNAILVKLFNDHTAEQIRQMGQKLARKSGTIALMAAVNEQTTLVFTRAKDAPGHMGQLIQTARTLIDARGGGGPNFGQATGAVTSEEKINTCLAAAKMQLLKNIKSTE